MRPLVVFTLTLLIASSGRADGLTLLLQAPESGRVPPGAVIELAAVRVVDGVMHPVGAVTFSEAIGDDNIDPYVMTARARAPASGAFTITARSGAEEAKATLAVDAAALGTLSVRVEPESAMRGDSALPPILVFIETTAGAVTPSVTASVGSLGALKQIAPGRYVADYTPREVLFPEVVVFTAARQWPHEGSATFSLAHAVLSLSSSIVLPGETQPAHDITVEIAGKKFGPVRSDERGLFKVPVMIPPGVGRGTGVSVDRLGNKRLTIIDLRLPPTNRIAATAFPRELVADGRSEAQIAVVVVDKTGAPSREAPRLRAQRGKIADVRAHGSGRFLARYTPPLTPGDDVIEATLPDGSRSDVTMQVRPGPPTSLSVSVSPTLVVAPSNERARIAVDVRDARNNVVADAHIVADAALGGTEILRVRGGGQAPALQGEVRYSAPPSALQWSDRVVVRATSANGRVASRVALTPRGIVALDAVGRVVPNARVRTKNGEVTSDASGLLPIAVTPGVLHAQLEGNAFGAALYIYRSSDGMIRGWPSHPGELVKDARVTLMEPVPVDVKASVVNGTLRWSVEGGGDGPRRVAISTAGQPSRIVERAGELKIDVVTAPITVTDVESGVSAVVLP